MGSLLGMMLNAGKSPSPGPPIPGGSGGMVMPGGSAGVNVDLTLIKAYKQNGTVYANVSLLAGAVAAQKWGLYRSAAPTSRFTTSDQGSDQRKQVAVHAALNVLEKPASILVPSGRRWPIWDRFGLFEISQIYLEQTGKSHWVVDTAERSSPIPLGLWPVRPDRMVPVPDKDRYLAGWLYRSPDGRESIPLYPDEVIFNRYPDPEDPYGGAGPIRSVITDIQAADYAAEWNKNYFINSAEPGGVIQVDHELQENEFDELVDRWRETHRGVARAHRIAVLEAGQTWVANAHSARDMDFANLRSVSRDIIREGLGMHKVMTGVTDDVNRANAQTGEEVFASWKVAPRLERWRNVLNTQFLPLFGATAQGNEFDFTYPTPENREQDNAELTTKATAYLTLVTAGVDPGDAAAVVGLPAMQVAERATQSPALPPGWVPEMAPAAPAAPVPDAPAAWYGTLAQARERYALAAPVLAKKDAAAKVFEQMAADYPASAMAWMHHATWAGPVMVPLDHVQPMMQWLDRADPAHVADFTEKRAKGKKLKPVLLVQTPGNPRLLLVDGHHRYLAEKQLGEPVRAFIGTVSQDHGPWEQMHDYQLHPSASAAWPGRRDMAAYNMAGAR